MCGGWGLMVMLLRSNAANNGNYQNADEMTESLAAVRARNYHPCDARGGAGLRRDLNVLVFSLRTYGRWIDKTMSHHHELDRKARRRIRVR
jgi:hypothetical protein